MSEAPLPVEPAAHRRPRVGYAMAASAATLWAVNGTVSKVILGSGISSLRLLEVRSLGAAIGFVLVLLVVAPARLRVTRRELPFLAVFGICGLAFVQWFYFLVDPPARGRDRAADRVPRRAARRAVGALRLPRAGAPPDLDRARAGARRPGDDRRPARRRRALERRHRVRARLGGHVHRATSSSPSAASATATPSRCSPGASASRRSSSP